MKKLLTIEWNKIWPYKTFRFLGIFYLAAIALFFFSPNVLNIPGLEIFTKELFRFPRVWPTGTYLVGHFFNLIPAFIIISFIANEYSYRTLRQNIIDGLSRKEFLASKVLTIIVLALVSTFYLFLVSFVVGWINTPDIIRQDAMFEDAGYIGVYFIQTIGFFLLSAFLAFILQRSALTIIVLLLYIAIVEPIIVGNIDSDFASFFPAATIFSAIPAKVMMGEAVQSVMGIEPIDDVIRPQFFAILAYIGIYSVAAYLLLKRRDL